MIIFTYITTQNQILGQNTINGKFYSSLIKTNLLSFWPQVESVHWLRYSHTLNLRPSSTDPCFPSVIPYTTPATALSRLPPFPRLLPHIPRQEISFSSSQEAPAEGAFRARRDKRSLLFSCLPSMIRNHTPWSSRTEPAQHNSFKNSSAKWIFTICLSFGEY